MTLAALVFVAWFVTLPTRATTPIEFDSRVWSVAAETSTTRLQMIESIQRDVLHVGACAEDVEAALGDGGKCIAHNGVSKLSYFLTRDPQTDRCTFLDLPLDDADRVTGWRLNEF